MPHLFENGRDKKKIYINIFSAERKSKKKRERIQIHDIRISHGKKKPTAAWHGSTMIEKTKIAY